MKTIYLLLWASIVASTATAQIDASNFSASFSGNYTMYKGNFKKSTPGAKIDIGYSASEKVRFSLGYSYHAPIKVPSTISTSNGSDLKDVASEIKYNFSTISFAANYTFINTEEDIFSIYVPVGASYVIAKYKEESKVAYPQGYTPLNQLEPGKETGFTINAGLGAQYNLGTVRVFGDAGFAIPANQANGQYIQNNIPVHLVFNAGIRIPFGMRDFE